jgi:hypothetical protein
MSRAPKKLARLEAVLRHPELGDRERVLLQAYLHFEPQHGGACGQPGVCWPTDAELGAFLGRSDVTIRRGRRTLAAPGIGVEPFIRVRYVPPFSRLPNGEQAWHGANVVTLLELASPAADVASQEHAEADAEVVRLELELGKARRRAAAAAAKASVERAIAGEDAAPANDGSSRNAPSLTALGWSPWPGLARSRGGEQTAFPFARRAG